MVEYLCIIQARLNSSRLPAKVMLDLAGKTLLERVYESVNKSTKISKIVVATSNKTSDDIIANKLSSLGIECYRGDLNNVLERFYKTSLEYKAKNIVRITADNPLMDGRIIDDLIEVYEKELTDYAMFSNAIYGLSAEVFSANVLLEANKNARNNFDKEHVTPYIKDMFTCHIEDISDIYKIPTLSITVDTLEDYIKMNNFYSLIAKNNEKADIDTFIKYHLKTLQ